MTQVTPTHKAWLPRNAYFDPSVSAVIHQLFCDWADEWFAKNISIGCEAMELNHAAIQTLNGRSHKFALINGSATLLLSDSHFQNLVEMLVGDVIKENAKSGFDNEILERLAESAISDLKKRFSDRFEDFAEVHEDKTVENAIAAVKANEGLMFRINQTGKGELLAIVVSFDLLASYRKFGLTNKAIKLCDEKLGLEINKHQTRVEAFLGRSQVKLNELRSFEVGDVLVLDSKLDQPVHLVVDGNPAQELMCYLEKSKKQVSLKLTSMEEA